VDYFKETEELLYSVPKKEKAVEQLKRRRERLTRQNAPDEVEAVDPSAVYIKSSFADTALNDLCELADITASIAQTEEEIAEIKRCVEAIQDEELKTCLKLWYFQRETKEQIAERLERWSISTVYAKRNRAIREFAILYWGSKIK